jgi:hypothetical protein
MDVMVVAKKIESERKIALFTNRIHFSIIPPKQHKALYLKILHHPSMR